MNIFVLDECPEKSARYMCDKHVVKMTLETAQLLSTTHRIFNNNDEKLYRATHKNHPCAVWARESKENYQWLYEHFRGLSSEYTYRYNKIHKSWEKLYNILCKAPAEIDAIGMTSFALAMPDECKVKDSTVESYRNYYNVVKRDICKWTRRNTPEWFDTLGT